MSHHIVISWDANPSPVDGYNVFRGTAPGNESSTPYNTSLVTELPAFSLSSVTASSGGNATYTGTIPANLVVSVPVIVAGFSNAVNNGKYVIVSFTATTLVLANAHAVAESAPATGTANPFFEDDAVFPGKRYSYQITAVAGGIESIDSLGIFSVAVPFPFSPASIDMGAATSFEILAGSTVTNTGATSAAGDVGVFPGTSITGFGSPASISGVFHIADFVASAAQGALSVAYTKAQAMTGAVVLSASSFELGGSVLAPGVYNIGSSAAITGSLVLDAGGDPNAVWVFQIGSTLTTAAASNVVLVGGAQADNVFWQVGSSATLGTDSSFAGTIMAQASITATTGARVNGRLLARTGAVTLDTDEVIMLLASFLAQYQPSTNYTLGTITYDCVSNSFQEVIIAGKSGVTHPTFSNVFGTVTQDGSVTWISLDPPTVSVMVSLPPSRPNVPPAPPSAPTNPLITSEV